jgi:hypothetical protein
MNELTIDGNIYISSKKAAEITGYAKDYIGQLCREGHVEARMVGRSWYVLESSIRAHRFGGDPRVAARASEQIDSQPVSPLDGWEKPTYVSEMAPTMLIPTRTHATETPVAEENPLSEASAADTLTDMQAAWKEWFDQKKDHLIETPEIIDAREEEHEEELVENDSLAPEITTPDATEVINEPLPAYDALLEAPEGPRALLTEDTEDSYEAVAIQPINRMVQPVSVPVPVSIATTHVSEAPAPATHYELSSAPEEELEAGSEPIVIHRSPVSEAAHDEEERRIVRREVDRREAETDDILVPSKKERAIARKAKSRSQRQSYLGPLVIRALLIGLMGITIAITVVGSGYADQYIHGTLGGPIFNFLGGTSTYSK